MTETQAPLTLSGVIPPMITPLTEAGQVDGPAIERLVEYLIESGVSGLFVLGSSGEGPWLTSTQRQQVIQGTARAAAGRVPVLAGVLEPGTDRALEAAQMAADAGADALVVTSPYYFGAEAAVQIHHVSTIAAANPLPLVLYNIPTATHNPMAPHTVRALLEIDNLIGIKDSAGNWEDFQELLALRRIRPDFRVLQGAERLAAPSVLAGADGLVPGMGNLAPGLFDRLVQSAQAGERERALALQERVEALWHLHTHGFWLACLKYAASLLGFGSGAVCGWPADHGGSDGPNPLSGSAKAAIGQIVRSTIAEARPG